MGFGLYYNSLIFQYKGSPFGSFNESLLLVTPNLIVTSKDTSEIWYFGDSSPFDKFTGTDFNAQYGAPHWFGKLQNSSNEIWIRAARGTFFTNLFYYPLNDYTPLPDLRFQLYQNASLIDSGKIYDKPDQ